MSHPPKRYSDKTTPAANKCSSSATRWTSWSSGTYLSGAEVSAKNLGKYGADEVVDGPPTANSSLLASAFLSQDGPLSRQDSAGFLHPYIEHTPANVDYSDTSIFKSFSESGYTDNDGFAANFLSSDVSDSQHFTSHEDDVGRRYYNCTWCSYNTLRKDNLIVHIRRHTGFKPHSCTVCGKKFSDKSNFNSHVRRHTEIANSQ